MDYRVVKRRKRKEFTSSLDSLSDPVQLAVAMFDVAYSRVAKYNPWLRMSGMMNCCVREYVLGHSVNRTGKHNIDTNMAVIFDIGSGLHRTMQNSARYLGGRLVGRWECFSCGHVTAVGIKPNQCDKCKGRAAAMRYREVQLRIRGCRGHPDGFIQLEQALLRLIEIKSISSKEFVRLRSGPIAEHAYQLNGYMAMANILEQKNKMPITIDTGSGYVVYVSKEHPGARTYPLKVYRVEREPAYQQDALKKINLYNSCYDPIQKLVKELPPPVEECVRGNFLNFRAKRCPVGKECKKGR